MINSESFFIIIIKNFFNLNMVTYIYIYALFINILSLGYYDLFVKYRFSPSYKWNEFVLNLGNIDIEPEKNGFMSIILNIYIQVISYSLYYY